MFSVTCRSAAPATASARPTTRGARRSGACTRRSRLAVSAHTNAPHEHDDDLDGPVSTIARESAQQLIDRAAGKTVLDYPSGQDFDSKMFRRQLNTSGRYLRNPLNDKASLDLMEEHGVGYSKRGLVSRMRESGFEHREGDVTVFLAESYGFCWGVERAVQMAYEARRSYPGRKLWITNEIIHNPAVNGRLKEMEVGFIEADKAGLKDFSAVGAGDVVILPAFGASVQEMQLLNDKSVQIVDTTCPWVSKVWNAVDVMKKKTYTSIIHGKWQHEETIATLSFASDYVVVKDLPEAQYVADYITKGGDRAAFLKKFEKAVSKGFDPDTQLARVGVANQTTMLKGETEQIGKLFESTMMAKFGPAELKEHFMVTDTICDATQERQDAMYALVEKQVDLVLVVGGYNSSNTSHLQEIAEHKNLPSFWVDLASRIDVAANTIDHRLMHGELKQTTGWLKPGPLRVGITSGASTPDKVVEDVLDAVFAIKKGMK